MHTDTQFYRPAGVTLSQPPSVTSRRRSRLRERLALYNRIFCGFGDHEAGVAETHIGRATEELAALLRLLCEEEDLIPAPMIFAPGPGECGLICEGHPQKERVQQCLEQIPGLATAILHALHLHYTGQIMREYQHFQEYYRECFSSFGKEAAQFMSARYEASPCPAPQLVFDGRMMNVAFAGKAGSQRLKELNATWQPVPTRLRPRTVDRYFPGLFAKHMP